MKSICATKGVSAAGSRKESSACADPGERDRGRGLHLEQDASGPGRGDDGPDASGQTRCRRREQRVRKRLHRKRGIRDAEEMCAIAAAPLGLEPESVGVASTGVIGRYLNLPLIRDQCERIARSSPGTTMRGRSGPAIMTTDTFPKHALVETGSFSVGGITKGAG